ncbi:hypothetical protein [Thermobifida halotolerans]|uniref:hypothetical protein n=1 Tax=Thermobifida halotolerans TaxID=483545 RepID=UPI000A61E66A|nr:hypothetical protein [Thermobifida halotolerans]
MPATAVAVAKPWPHAVVKPANDSTAVSLALAKWHGKQAASPRDLPDGYAPSPVSVPVPGSAWRVSPSASAPVPVSGALVGLPPVRAPPLTTLV